MKRAVMPSFSIERRRERKSTNQPDAYLLSDMSRQKQNLNGSAPHFSDSPLRTDSKRCAGRDESPTDASSSGRSDSNLKRFLYYTTPRTFSQLYSKTFARGLSSKGYLAPTSRHCFFLSDLWNSFDEWSAYGAGVPIVLNGRETVMQYYVPYLSAIQLYTSSASVPLSKNRRLGEDSDGSDMGSSDGEVEKACILERRASSPELSGSFGFDREQGPICHRRRQWSSVDIRGNLLLEDDELWQEEDVSETVLYEYFETEPPSFRVPLHDKVGELARQFPALKTLKSSDLSRSSWISVAWYPIYRIPVGPTLKDLAACFLTYHQLSTPPADEAHDLSCMLLPPYNDQDHIALHPFGLVSYKVRGVIWSSAGVADSQYAMSLQRSSDDWLKRLHVQHPDFKFFMSHGPSMRY